MAKFNLTPSQVSILTSCLSIGVEGIDAAGGTSEDNAAIEALLAELSALDYNGHAAEVTIETDALGTLMGGSMISGADTD